MSWEMLGRVIKESKADNGCLLVMMALANYSNDDDQAWPAIATLEKVSRLSERQVRTNLRKLEQMGEITSSGRGPKGTVRYKITPGAVSTGAVSAPLGGQFAAVGGAVSAPEPLEEPCNGEPLKSSAPAAAVDLQKVEHKLFMESWDEAFEIQFRRRYVFAGGKDGMALKRLLSASKQSATDLMKIATRAWSRIGKGKQFWNCEKAVSIAGFCSRFNEILAELHRPKPGDVIQHAPSAPAKSTSGKLRLIDRPVRGWSHPVTDQPMTAEEVNQLYPIENYE